MALLRIRIQTIEGRSITSRNGQDIKQIYELQNLFMDEWEQFDFDIQNMIDHLVNVINFWELEESYINQCKELSDLLSDIKNEHFKHKNDWQEIGKTKYL